MATKPTKQEIINGLNDLNKSSSEYSFDNYMSGLELLNPKFKEIRTLIENSGGLIANGLKDQFTNAFNHDPKALQMLIDLASNNAGMDSFIKLLGTERGQKKVWDALQVSITTATGNKAARIEPEVRVMPPTKIDMDQSGVTKLFTNNGVQVTENMEATPANLANIGKSAFKLFVWDDKDPLWVNLASQVWTVGSIAAGIFSGGTGTAAGLTAKTTVMAGLKRMLLGTVSKTAVKTGIKQTVAKAPLVRQVMKQAGTTISDTGGKTMGLKGDALKTGLKALTSLFGGVAKTGVKAGAGVIRRNPIKTATAGTAAYYGKKAVNAVETWWNKLKDMVPEGISKNLDVLTTGGLGAAFGLASGGLSTAIMVGSLALAGLAAWKGNYKEAGMLAAGGFAANQALKGNLSWATLGVVGAVASYLAPENTNKLVAEQVAKITPAANPILTPAG